MENNIKELKEMSKDDFIEQLKSAMNEELYTNIYEDDTQVNNDDKEQLLSDFNKFTKLIRKYKKVQTELKELAMLNKENEELQRYIKLLEKLDSISKDLDIARKGYLYESAIKVPNANLENKDVKVTITLPYSKKDFDTATFEKDYGPDTEMYQKYMITKQVKGNIKYKIK